MANNRMFLIHKPSMLAIQLGKRMGEGWYDAPEKSELERFFDHVGESSKGQDDFALAMEDCENSCCFEDWQYAGESVNGFIVFKYKNPYISRSRQ